MVLLTIRQEKKGKKLGPKENLLVLVYTSKNLGAYGDAGIITTNNKKKYEYLKKLSNLGSKKILP